MKNPKLANANGHLSDVIVGDYISWVHNNSIWTGVVQKIDVFVFVKALTKDGVPTHDTWGFCRKQLNSGKNCL